MLQFDMMGVNDLTKNEKLYVSRLREGMSQKEYALNKHKRSVSVFSRWERIPGLPTCPKDIDLGETLSNLEKCIILRRRHNLHQAELAAILGITRPWLNKIEKSKATPAKLIAYWKEKLNREQECNNTPTQPQQLNS